MTSTEIAPASIEHLDHEIMCGAENHNGPLTRADYFVDQHGCASYLVCTECLRTQREWFEGEVMRGCMLLCDHCYRESVTFEDAYPLVVPL